MNRGGRSPAGSFSGRGRRRRSFRLPGLPAPPVFRASTGRATTVYIRYAAASCAAFVWFDSLGACKTLMQPT
ncbi:MAG: hypothetical protein WHS90_01795 [Caldilinea sp.]|uniref:hypothetical protein n=1 Tax=Caldilinea sp. TaxID=2293560 RepID=UPI0026340D7B|nr:hypothetical protein [uncultured Caldilinea sp.]